MNFLKSGGFLVQIGDQNSFGRVPVDETCEEMVHKDTQGASKQGAPKASVLKQEQLASII